MKKILIALLIILVAAGGFFFYMSLDRYDAEKYTASTSKGLVKGSFMKFKLPSPTNQDIYLDSSVRKLIVAFTKEQGHMVNEYLASQPKNFMQSKKAMLLLDISKVPVTVRNTFVLPSLKSSNYRTALIYNDKIGDVFKDPDHANETHIITVMHNRIYGVTFVSNKAQLAQALQ